jgi:pantetheine-phosphate adenylyltransferase
VRVVGGNLRGRKLVAPVHGVRPTSDRVRESLFMRLGELGGLRVLDLYAGSGALGIESISRGAEGVVFVEKATASLRAVEKNLSSLGLTEAAVVLRGDAQAVLRRLAREGRRFDLVFLDPPYASGELEAVIPELAESGVLDPAAVVVVESPKRNPLSLAESSPFSILDARSAGETTITRLVIGTGREGRAEEEGLGNDMAAEQNRAETASDVASREGGDPSRSVALFPASFDPITNGHLDLIERALKVFDEVVVAVAINVGKNGTFDFDERIGMLNEVLAGRERVRVEGFSGLVVEHARAINATAIIRGLRAMSDFEYEFEMALMNRHLEPDVEVLFMMTRQEYFYVSSSRLKELVRFGANVEDFLPEVVTKRLREKLGPI